MKILITGGDGLIGSYLASYLKSKKLDIWVPSKKELDITDKKELRDFFEEVKPDAVVHGAAVAGILSCEQERGDKGGNVWRVNVKGVENIVSNCLRFDSYLIFLSAEVVFAGLKTNPGPFGETDIPSDEAAHLSWYGFSKRTAERTIQDNIKRASIVRLCSVVGSKIVNSKLDYLQKVVRDFDRGELKPRFVDQHIGITDIADVCEAVNGLCSRRLEGVFHIASKDVCTPYEFSDYVLLKVKGIKGAVSKSTIGEFLKQNPNTFGQYLGLKCTKTAGELKMNFNTWKDIVGKNLS